jgi:DNA-binding NarL/FixJ family response regulator
MNPKAKVLLVDDHPLVREWLANLIQQQDDMEVCGDAGNPAAALRAAAATAPDVAVIDLALEDASGLELIKNLRVERPELRMVVLSMHDETVYAERALRAGARGYVMKREATRKILQAIRRVLAGELYVSDRVREMFAEKFVGGRPPVGESPVTGLSDRELEVFRLLGRGRNNRQIADELHVSIKTVQEYCARIKDKLKVGAMNELVREAIHWQETHPDD